MHHDTGKRNIEILQQHSISAVQMKAVEEPSRYDSNIEVKANCKTKITYCYLNKTLLSGEPTKNFPCFANDKINKTARKSTVTKKKARVSDRNN